MAKTKGLGRGLDALFASEEDPGSVAQLRVSEIYPNPDQPRRDFDEDALNELAESIRKNGVIQPLAVRKVDDGYQIIAGERRWRACRLAGTSHVPAIVLDVDEKAAFELALIENLQREDLNPIEEAQGFQKLMDSAELTQEEAAQRVGRSRPAVANALRLLTLPKPVMKLVREKKLSAGHARALLAIQNAALMAKAAQLVIAKALSVRETEGLAKTYGKEQPEKKEHPDAIYIRQLEREMAALTSHRITIKSTGKKGRLTVDYSDNDDLELICEALKLMKKSR